MQDSTSNLSKKSSKFSLLWDALRCDKKQRKKRGKTQKSKDNRSITSSGTSLKSSITKLKIFNKESTAKQQLSSSIAIPDTATKLDQKSSTDSYQSGEVYKENELHYLAML
jgi:hypothetical protein